MIAACSDKSAKNLSSRLSARGILGPPEQFSGPAASSLGHFSGTDEPLFHLPAERIAVQRFAADGLVEPPQLEHGEGVPE